MFINYTGDTITIKKMEGVTIEPRRKVVITSRSGKKIEMRL